MGKTPAGRTRERVYRYVREQLLRGMPPTVREVQEAFRFKAVQTAREHLETLVAEGRLRKHPGRSRGYRLPETPFASSVLIPLLGRVQAGGLNTAVEELEGYLPVEMRGSQHLFGLRVRGDSMSGAGILSGDIVIVRRQSSAEPGDIVVALVGEEATVKRLRLHKDRVELHPENPAYEPIVPPPGELNLLGKVIEVRRIIGK